jgi:hypothetical protein
MRYRIGIRHQKSEEIDEPGFFTLEAAGLSASKGN